MSNYRKVFLIFAHMEKAILNFFGDKAGMILCLAGSRKVLFNGKLYHLRRGMLCFSSPILPLYELSRDADYQEATIVDEMEVFYRIIRQIANQTLGTRMRSYPCLQLNEAQINLFLEKAELIASKRALIQTLSDTYEQHMVRLMTQLLEQEVMLEFVFLYLRSQDIVNPVAGDPHTMIAFQFLFLLNKYYQTERSVGYYASQANLSPSHFTRIVKENTGKTPSEWIATITIYNAQLLLRQTNKSIKEIAAELHFPEQFTFRKFFKLHVGLSPKDYRTQK